MSTYANKTTVKPEKTRQDIEKEIYRFGGTDFTSANMESMGKAYIMFKINKWRIRFELTLPQLNDPKFYHHRQSVKQGKYEQAIRTLWRSLYISIKAKLTAVETGIETVEVAFMPQIMLPDNTVVGEHVLPTLIETYETGTVIPMLPNYNG